MAIAPATVGVIDAPAIWLPVPVAPVGSKSNGSAETGTPVHLLSTPHIPFVVIDEVKVGFVSPVSAKRQNRWLRWVLLIAIDVPRFQPAGVGITVEPEP